MDDIERRGFAHIVDVALIRTPMMWIFEPFTGFDDIVQRVLDLVNDKMRHLAVDVAGEFDEARFNAGLLGLPGQIERIDRNAVPAEARARDKTA